MDGVNYDFWKPRMVAYLKSLDSRAWKAVIIGWSHPVTEGEDGEPTTKLKPEEDWSKEEDELALGNSKALNAKFNEIDMNISRHVNNCEVAKDAWEILRTTHEGTSKVKMSRLQLLTTQFENMRMKDDESINDFHMNILEIANASSALGDKLFEEKLVRKILRSLPKRFDMNVAAIEEAQDISNIRVDELFGSLQTFELGMSDSYEKKNKSIAFVSNTNDEEEECDLDIDEGLSNVIVLLRRQFNKVMKRMDMKSRSNVKNNSSDISKSNDFGRKPNSEEKSSQSKGIQCHGCEGFSHIRFECPTYLKKKKKSLAVTWSGEESKSELEEESAKCVTVLTGRYVSNEDSCDDELIYDELVASYR